jgi:hypothetical protein
LEIVPLTTQSLENVQKSKIQKIINRKKLPKNWHQTFINDFNVKMQEDNESMRLSDQDSGDLFKRLLKTMNLEINHFKEKYLSLKTSELKNWNKSTRAEIAQKFLNPLALSVTLDEDDPNNAEEEEQEVIQEQKKKENMLASSLKPAFKQIVSKNLTDTDQKAVLDCLIDTQITATNAIIGVEILVNHLASKITQGAMKKYHISKEEEDINISIIPSVDIVIPFQGNLDELKRCIASIIQFCPWMNSIFILIPNNIDNIEDQVFNSKKIRQIKISSVVNDPIHEIPNLLEHFLLWDPCIVLNYALRNSYFFTKIKLGNVEMVQPKVGIVHSNL